MLKQIVLWGVVVVLGWLWWARRRANRRSRTPRSS
jgi:hypothetical protein